MLLRTSRTSARMVLKCCERMRSNMSPRRASYNSTTSCPMTSIPEVLNNNSKISDNCRINLKFSRIYEDSRRCKISSASYLGVQLASLMLSLRLHSSHETFAVASPQGFSHETIVLHLSKSKYPVLSEILWVLGEFSNGKEIVSQVIKIQYFSRTTPSPPPASRHVL